MDIKQIVRQIIEYIWVNVYFIIQFWIQLKLVKWPSSGYLLSAEPYSDYYVTHKKSVSLRFPTVLLSQVFSQFWFGFLLVKSSSRCFTETDVYEITFYEQLTTQIRTFPRVSSQMYSFGWYGGQFWWTSELWCWNRECLFSWYPKSKTSR